MASHWIFEWSEPGHGSVKPDPQIRAFHSLEAEEELIRALQKIREEGGNPPLDEKSSGEAVRSEG
jgi:hypothetical protein